MACHGGARLHRMHGNRVLGHHKPVENLPGGLATIRYIHHILTWGFVLFIVVHVYMAFWYDAVLKEGTLSSMVSGYMFETGDH